MRFGQRMKRLRRGLGFFHFLTLLIG